MINRVFRSRFGQNLAFKRFFSDYDLIIIGGGPGGYVSAIKAGQLGLKTVCIEKRGALGGTCLNVGCIPSKALLNISHKYHEMQHAADYGLIAPNTSFDWGKVQGKKETIVKGLVRGIEGLLKKNGVTYKIGAGKLNGNGKVEITGNDGTKEIVSAKNILIATGSEPTPFPGIKFDEKIFVSSTGALSLEKVPESLVVIGAGVIGLELGSVYARLGTKVQVIEFADKAIASMDSDLGKALEAVLKKQGLSFKFNTKVLSGKIENGKASIVVDHKDGGKQETIVSDV